MLENFTNISDLEEQREKLQAMLDACLQKKSAREKSSSDDQLLCGSKNRRRTLRKQLERVNARIAELQKLVEIGECLQTESQQRELINPKVKDGWGFWRN